MIFLCLGKKLDMIQITCYISSLRFLLFLIFPVSFRKIQNCVFKYPISPHFPRKVSLCEFRRPKSSVPPLRTEFIPLCYHCVLALCHKHVLNVNFSWSKVL